jgi:hypothetical protein
MFSALVRAVVLAASLHPVNIPLPAGEQSTCQPGPSAACASELVAALDTAQSFAGVPALVLPADFARTPPAEALMVLINAERRSWGLPAATFSGALDAVAAKAAANVADPTLPIVCCYGSIEAQESAPWTFSVSGLYLADYCWTFWDGAHSPNANGPFAHTEILLGDFGPHPIMGAAAVATHGLYVLTVLIEQVGS